jgi:flagellar hook-associated protein 1
MNIQNIGDSTSRASFIDTSLKANGLGITSNTSGMKIDNYFKDTVDRLGVQAQEAKRVVKNQESLLNSFEETRLSISGVSLDEEMANLVQFQHAYQANAKIIATVDELLDVVVNGLKR